MSTETFEDSTTDLFDDTLSSKSTREEDLGKTEAEKPEKEDEAEEGADDTGEEDADDADTAEDEEEGDDKEKKTEKMIPESRLKAAIKDISSELDEAKSQIAQLTAKPAPDRSVDPDGYDLHNRIEISKSIMRDAYPDYNQMIAKYQEMAKENPSLNVAVANHPNPAKYAYEIAKKAKDIEELSALRDSPDWKEFHEWKKLKKEEEKTAKIGRAHV